MGLSEFFLFLFLRGRTKRSGDEYEDRQQEKKGGTVQSK